MLLLWLLPLPAVRSVVASDAGLAAGTAAGRRCCRCPCVTVQWPCAGCACRAPVLLVAGLSGYSRLETPHSRWGLFTLYVDPRGQMGDPPGAHPGDPPRVALSPGPYTRTRAYWRWCAEATGAAAPAALLIRAAAALYSAASRRSSLTTVARASGLTPVSSSSKRMLRVS